jgi:hypothetical protein
MSPHLEFEALKATGKVPCTTCVAMYALQLRWKNAERCSMVPRYHFLPTESIVEVVEAAAWPGDTLRSVNL